MKTAIELDAFTAIAEGADAAEALARRCNTSERGMRILCDYLVVIGFLTKHETSYDLTPDTALFLVRSSPAYAGTAVRFLSSQAHTESFKNLTAAVRKGGTVAGGEGMFTPDNPIWVDFARGMAPLMALQAELIAELLRVEAGQRCKVLDIAAGHGLFGIAIARRNPNAEVIAVDSPSVLEVARENARTAGVIGRYDTISGSAFEVDFGGGYDIALITNFLHAFDAATNQKLLRRVHAALKPGGRAIALEFIPNEDRVSPPVAASFGLTMLVNTERGDTHTPSEMKEMFRNAGFSSTGVRALPPTFQQVALSQK